MTDIKSDKNTDIFDRNERVSLMEPMLIGSTSRHHERFTDLALTLTDRAAGFRRSLPESIRVALADLVRAMNCYYSNLIEGHDTHPIDIERALKNDYSQDPQKRDLQLEAKAHIAVQSWIDAGELANPTSAVGICEIHRRFTELLPDELRWVDTPDRASRERVMPGELRKRDVKVGRHVPVRPSAVPNFLDRFESAYSGLGRANTIISAAAAHHRLLWIHPFVDGNGRVARLMSHATLRDALDTGGIWSIARGLARNATEYKTLLSNCDLPRRNDTDGRGNLSEEALAEFTEFFLNICIDQIKFMEQLMQPDRFRARVRMWAEEETRIGALPSQATDVLEAMLFQGELPKSEVATRLGVTARHAQRITGALVERGVIRSANLRAPWVLAFPAALASRWMPGLFPEA
ncbi:MAG: Fic family protein [Gammaproteobacteria bacterium]